MTDSFGIRALVATAAVTVACAAQAQDIKRTPFQKVEVPGGAYEVVFGMAEFSPNVTVARHTHPGPVLFYIAEGEFMLAVEGQPEKVMKAGESSQLQSGAVHVERAGAAGAKAIAVYLVPKGQPLATAAK